jgi:nucleotide-binding universal stress UspA family protein
MSETLVVAVDETEAAQRAVTAAGDLALRLGDRVLVLHVLEEFLTGRGSHGRENPDAVTEVIETAVKRLKDRGVDAEGIAVRGIAGASDVAAAIVQRAKQTSAEYIVTGTHGRSAAGKLVLGSVANTIIRTADCPVLVVR